MQSTIYRFEANCTIISILPNFNYWKPKSKDTANVLGMLSREGVQMAQVRRVHTQKLSR